MKKRIVIANWKMYIDSPKEAVKYTAALRKKARSFTRSTGSGQAGVEAWIASPAPLLPVVAGVLKGSKIKTGGQMVSPFDSAQDKAHTGEVSAAMLKQAGAQFCIVGHSERRALGEDNNTVHEQFARALGAGLAAVLCVGETERSAEGAHFSFIESQLASAFAGVGSVARRAVVAYEPLWAINKSAADAVRLQELEEMAIFIKKVLTDILGRAAAAKVPILYGGSVEGSNAGQLLESGISGFLVGHASADIGSFIEILTQCRK